MVANAPVEVKNTGTGVAYRTTTTDTGNYSVQQLPIGNYDVTVTVQGFKGFNRKGLTLSAAQVMRIDIPLEVGSSAESVTVTGEATLLKTENGALVHNVTINQLDNIPILTTNGNFRDPFALLLLIPGSNYASSSFSVNGAPTNTQNILISGQTANHTGAGTTGLTSQSAAQRGRDSGGCGSNQQLRGGIRRGWRRHLQRHHEVGHQPVSRHVVRLPR